MSVPFRNKARAQHACEHVMPHQALRALLEPLGLHSLTDVTILLVYNIIKRQAFPKQPSSL